MSRTALITGGAGFIGSHLADELLKEGWRVRALDCLDSQVHGDDPQRPEYLDPEVELIVGDVRDAAAVEHALRSVDVVFHFAAKVGVGQSMYRIGDYTSVNNLGTAVLLEALAKNPVKRLLVASSMSVYGEGEYEDNEGRRIGTAHRTQKQLKDGHWDPVDERLSSLTPVPTTEKKSPSLQSIYALSKFDQEQMCLMCGRAYGMETTALRFFNVYGPRQALSNPYTGVLAIFAARLLNDRSPLIFEDGRQLRDFVSVYDVARACRLALDGPSDCVFNIGSGQALSVCQIADKLASVLERRQIRSELTGRYRFGDVRHCFADISRAKRLLGYTPQIDLETGIRELARELAHQTAIDRVSQATRELSERGLTA